MDFADVAENTFDLNTSILNAIQMSGGKFLYTRFTCEQGEVYFKGQIK